MAVIAGGLNDTATQESWTAAADALAVAVNNKLWNDDMGGLRGFGKESHRLLRGKCIVLYHLGCRERNTDRAVSCRGSKPAQALVGLQGLFAGRPLGS